MRGYEGDEVNVVVPGMLRRVCTTVSREPLPPVYEPFRQERLTPVCTSGTVMLDTVVHIVVYTRLLGPVSD